MHAELREAEALLRESQAEALAAKAEAGWLAVGFEVGCPVTRSVCLGGGISYTV